MVKAFVVYRRLLKRSLKLRIYKAPVVTYGCESWKFGEAEQNRLRAWNCRKLCTLVGLEFREEYNSSTVDVVGWVRA